VGTESAPVEPVPPLAGPLPEGAPPAVEAMPVVPPPLGEVVPESGMTSFAPPPVKRRPVTGRAFTNDDLDRPGAPGN
jgi:hypothetical protein